MARGKSKGGAKKKRTRVRKPGDATQDCNSDSSDDDEGAVVSVNGPSSPGKSVRRLHCAEDRRFCPESKEDAKRHAEAERIGGPVGSDMAEAMLGLKLGTDGLPPRVIPVMPFRNPFPKIPTQKGVIPIQDVERSPLHQRCKERIEAIKTEPDVDKMAELFCRYGAFLKGEKERLAERGEQQMRKDSVLVALYKQAMIAGNGGKMDRIRKDKEINEKGFEITKMEAAVLNAHLDYFKTQALHRQLQEMGKTWAVQVGERDFVMRPEIDLPDVSFEDVLAEERAAMAAEAMQKRAAAGLPLS